MKIFISMGMKSKSTEQVRVEMESVFSQIKAKLPEAELIDSIIDGADKHIAIEGDSVGLWYLGKSLELLAEADLVYFINDYEEYRGCRVEKMCAQEYGKMCVEFKTS
jgi:hypothetical protein